MRAINIIFVFIIISSLFLSCDETVSTKVAIEDNFTNVTSGEITANVELGEVPVSLQGKIEMFDAKFSIYLASPFGDTVYTSVFTENGEHKIDETFPRIDSVWTLSYSIEKINDANPEGNFEFSISY